jgi:hypothetical protein
MTRSVQALGECVPGGGNVSVNLPKRIIDRAWDAQVRLCRRYRKLAARGKDSNTAVVAVARGLAGFIWDITRLSMSLAIPRID